MRASHALSTELRTKIVRRDSNPRPCDHEVTALFTTGCRRGPRDKHDAFARGSCRRLKTTTREQAIAETPASQGPPGSALSAELPVHMTPGGIRTRDLSCGKRCNSDLHHGAWRGLAGNKRCCCCPCGRTAFRRAGLEPARHRSALPRSNRHLHHRQTGASTPAIDRYAGERAISVSVTTTQRLALRARNCAGPRADLCQAASRCVCQSGIRTRSFQLSEVSDIFTTSVG